MRHRNHEVDLVLRVQQLLHLVGTIEDVGNMCVVEGAGTVEGLVVCEQADDAHRALLAPAPHLDRLERGKLPNLRAEVYVHVAVDPLEFALLDSSDELCKAKILR